jgi:hypothetical protein
MEYLKAHVMTQMMNATYHRLFFEFVKTQRKFKEYMEEEKEARIECSAQANRRPQQDKGVIEIEYPASVQRKDDDELLLEVFTLEQIEHLDALHAKVLVGEISQRKCSNRLGKLSKKDKDELQELYKELTSQPHL